MVFYRHPARGRKDRLADDRPVTLILRPDLEDRNFHEVTKAFTGSEHHFPAAVTGREKGFVFHPTDHHVLDVSGRAGRFFH
jgi:starch synthase (maltosyl-transferring)